MRFVSPTSDSKVRFLLADGGGETLWATQVGIGLYRIDSVPFFIDGLAFGDVVYAPDDNGMPTARSMVTPSGASTLRLIAPSRQALRDCMAALALMGCRGGGYGRDCQRFPCRG